MQWSVLDKVLHPSAWGRELKTADANTATLLNSSSNNNGNAAAGTVGATDLQLFRTTAAGARPRLQRYIATSIANHNTTHCTTSLCICAHASVLHPQSQHISLALCDGFTERETL